MSISKKQLLLGACVTLSILVASVFLFVWTLLQPVSDAQTINQVFVIKKGEAVGSIAYRLQEAGLIKNANLFKLLVRFKGLGPKLQAGSFDLSPTQTPHEIAQQLTKGTQDVWITILEGWRVEQVAEYLDAQEELTEFDIETFLSLSSESEGTLFPETYLVPREMTAEQLYELLTTQYIAQVDSLQSLIDAQVRPFEDVLIMASLVQREARDYTQMRHVAGILWNRIDLGMALQVDATLQYAKGKNAQGEWWGTPLSADKQITSLFNTYMYPGLPPGPICNPGSNALKAALDPLVVDDLFYLHAPSGEMYFAQTLDEHNANINRYLR